MAELLRPLEIGQVRLPNNLVLSPMAGFSDLPFRILARRHGAGLVCSEMVAAGSIDRGVRRMIVRMQTSHEERPTSIQLFGTDPDLVAATARQAQEGCEVLGFNMGCPAWQIRRQGCGAALLDHPERCEELVRAIKGASRRPLLVKMRAGNGGRMDVVAFARRMERAGADGIIFHARTAEQGYTGRSDWDLIRDVKAGVGIPVIGNGDITDGPGARAALLRSGSDGLALGRATLGDPRVFSRIAFHLETGAVMPAPTPQERLEDFLEYLRLAQGLDLETQHLLQQAQQFTRGIPGASRLRASFKGAATPLSEVRARFEAFVAAGPGHRAPRPVAS